MWLIACASVRETDFSKPDFPIKKKVEKLCIYTWNMRNYQKSLIVS